MDLSNQWDGHLPESSDAICFAHRVNRYADLGMLSIEPDI